MIIIGNTSCGVSNPKNMTIILETNLRFLGTPLEKREKKKALESIPIWIKHSTKCAIQTYWNMWDSKYYL